VRRDWNPPLSANIEDRRNEQPYIPDWTERGRDRSAGAEQSFMSDGLRVRDSSVLALELERVATAIVDDKDVGHPGGDAEPLEDRGLDGLAEAAVSNMEKEGVGKATHVQMSDNGALNLGLGEG